MSGMSFRDQAKMLAFLLRNPTSWTRCSSRSAEPNFTVLLGCFGSRGASNTFSSGSRGSRALVRVLNSWVVSSPLGRAVASRSGLADNDIDLFLDGSLRVGRGIPGESTVILGEWSLVSDIALEISLSNEVFTLVFEVVAFLHIMSVLSVEVIISSFVTPFWVCFDWVRGPEEPLFSNLEEDLNSG
ncbi:hypothetical protein GW17_00055988 [Ensete ventricosum]|nr:hypothetical protein GW17_00055988 [Ensete ventricosum]